MSGSNKYLIFYVPVGGGHEQASQTLKNMLLEKDPNANIIITNAAQFSLYSKTHYKENIDRYLSWIIHEPAGYDFGLNLTRKSGIYWIIIHHMMNRLNYILKNKILTY